MCGSSMSERVSPPILKDCVSVACRWFTLNAAAAGARVAAFEGEVLLNRSWAACSPMPLP